MSNHLQDAIAAILTLLLQVFPWILGGAIVWTILVVVVMIVMLVRFKRGRKPGANDPFDPLGRIHW